MDKVKLMLSGNEVLNAITANGFVLLSGGVVEFLPPIPLLS